MRFLDYDEVELKDEVTLMSRKVELLDRGVKLAIQSQDKPYGIGNTYKIPGETDATAPSITVSALEDRGDYMLVSGYKDGNKKSPGAWQIKKDQL